MTRKNTLRRRLCALLALLPLALLPLEALAETEIADPAEAVEDAAEFPLPEEEGAGSAGEAEEAPAGEAGDDAGSGEAAEAVEETDRPDLVGIWRAFLQDGSVVLLELREDGTCRLALGDTAYEATWVQEESVAYLAQNGSILPIYWNDQGITLSIAGKELQMERVDTTMVGTWVANLEDSEALLVLKPDGTCSMGVGTVKYNAKWTFSDNTLNLEQNGSVIQGVYDGECITLPVGAFELRFYRREQADGAVDATPETDQPQSAGAD